MRQRSKNGEGRFGARNGSSARFTGFIDFKSAFAPTREEIKKIVKNLLLKFFWKIQIFMSAIIYIYFFFFRWWNFFITISVEALSLRILLQNEKGNGIINFREFGPGLGPGTRRIINRSKGNRNRLSRLLRFRDFFCFSFKVGIFIGFFFLRCFMNLFIDLLRI